MYTYCFSLLSSWKKGLRFIFVSQPNQIALYMWGTFVVLKWIVLNSLQRKENCLLKIKSLRASETSAMAICFLPTGKPEACWLSHSRYKAIVNYMEIADTVSWFKKVLIINLIIFHLAIINLRMRCAPGPLLVYCLSI